MNVFVSGGFDDIRSRQLRFLEEAGRSGPLTVLLWPDETIQQVTGRAARFPFAERAYFLNAVRFVNRVIPLPAGTNPDALPSLPGLQSAIWTDDELNANSTRKNFCQMNGLTYRVFDADNLKGFPELPALNGARGRKKVIVTGSFDWFHSGHVRFFEEVSSYGELYVVVGHDANIRLLKGEGHPMLPQSERRYVVGSIRYVKQALISTGNGWLDAEPEIARIRPDIYAVNEDGDKGGKRDFCEKHGIDYLVLERIPKTGLPTRTSTDLRGF